jgi:predicted membrane protein
MDEMENKDTSVKAPSHGHNRIWIAIVLVMVGGALLLQELKAPIPDWIFSWPVLLIVIGITMGFNHGFRGASWAILILVGGIFMLDDLVPGFAIHRFIWPIVIIAFGLFMLVRPRRPPSREWQDWERKWKEKHDWKRKKYWDQKYSTPPPGAAAPSPSYSSEDFFESTSVFGGVKKVILSKNFKGGDITCFMGGCEIDLTQADIQGRVAIDVTQVFGGTKLIVPSHWQVSTEMTAFFGSIEDKRKQPVETTTDKILIIEGTSVFGGIEIRNY